MEDNEWRQSGLPGEEHRDGPGGVIYKCLYFCIERVHLCRKLDIWAIYPTLIMIVIIATPI